MNKLLVLIIILFVVGWVVYDNKKEVEQNEVLVQKTKIEAESLDQKPDTVLVLQAPTQNATISSPYIVSGQVRGYWFFEGSFPVELHDMQGNTIAITIAEAQGDWMTTEFVPFTANLIFTKPLSPISAVLEFKKDNPSGLPQNDNSIQVPITIE